MELKKKIISFVSVAMMLVAGAALGFAPRAAAMSTSDGSQSGGSYAALGDSVAAGLDLGGTTDQLCGRSNQAYPNLVAADLNLTLNNLACSGTRTTEGLYDSQTVNGTELASQIQRAFASGPPRLITITAGANDLYWQQFVQYCNYGNCGSAKDDLAVQALLVRVRYGISRALAEIQQLSGGQPPVVLVTGYYRPLAYGLTYAGAPGITANEASWLDRQIDALNSALQDVTNQFSFARFVPVDFSGYELNTSNPWVQGPNDPAPLHPTTAGQRAIANAVRGAVPDTFQPGQQNGQESISPSDSEDQSGNSNECADPNGESQGTSADHSNNLIFSGLAAGSNFNLDNTICLYQ